MVVVIIRFFPLFWTSLTGDTADILFLGVFEVHQAWGPFFGGWGVLSVSNRDWRGLTRALHDAPTIIICIMDTTGPT